MGEEIKDISFIPNKLINLTLDLLLEIEAQIIKYKLYRLDAKFDIILDAIEKITGDLVKSSVYQMSSFPTQKLYETNKKSKWIQNIDLKKNALRNKAKRENALKKDGTIKVSWMKEKLADPNTDEKTKKQIRLALNFRKMNEAKINYPNKKYYLIPDEKKELNYFIDTSNIENKAIFSFNEVKYLIDYIKKHLLKDNDFKLAKSLAKQLLLDYFQKVYS